MQEWGGADSYNKAEILRSLILERYSSNASSVMEVYELEDNLVSYMEEEFSLWLEDNSERHVAQSIIQMYEQCRQGIFTLSREMVAIAERLRLEQGYCAPVICQGNENDDDDDDDDDSCKRPSTNNCTNMNHDNSPADANMENTPSMMDPTSTFAASIIPPIIIEYATGSLFGNPAMAKKRETTQKVKRQLGEPTMEDKPMMDEDGFTVITRKNPKKFPIKKKKKRYKKITSSISLHH